MKILIISQYYDPEPIYIPATVARGLAERDHEVTVITGFPNYPHGRIYDGFTQGLGRTERDGRVKVLRTPLVISHSENPIGRLVNYLTFALSAMVSSWRVRGVDVVYVYATQMTPALGPSIMRAFGGAPYVMHVQDLWPESVTGSSMVGGGSASRVIAGVLKPWLRFLYKQATATIAIAPTMARMLVDRGVPSSRVKMVFNWANENVKDAVSGRAKQRVDGQLKSDRVLIVYAGNLGDHQDLETVIRAAKAVEDEKNVRFEFYGSGMAKDRLEALATELDVKNLTFCGSVSAADMEGVYDRADFQLVTLKDREIFRGTIPSKLQASLFNGSAVMSNVAGDVAEICSSEQVGLTCKPGSVDSMAEMFRTGAQTTTETRRQMAANGRDFYLNKMSLDQGMDALEKILLEAAAAGKSK
ncbi:glycosyltransferase family 4 protein [Pseudarthrobacter cellobiosi]|uniref:glycosyltransferase family 4 protein n=1 Tax=Pseudarthrobacter cellobiosi TaxID=2953654 RepID=UPI00208EA301|nr:glycosyltransferase family 4 protein [Pseudarthrobacter sp. HLT1-5]MCO4254747.1 glycosyltransferase family 4 protein [Pseudarthrobacter sp. HLT1-5]